MKILISGATGFIGNHLTEKLLREHHEVVALVRPSSTTATLIERKIPFYTFLDDIGGLSTFLEQEKFDGIIHLASLYLSQHKTEDIKALVDSNVFLGTALVEAAAKSKTPWFINTGTFWQHFKNKRYSPVNLYAATKQAFEDIGQYYSEIDAIYFVTIKLSDTFGPNDTRPKIFNLWAKAARENETLGMSPGEQKIDISYIENVTDAFLRLASLIQNDTKRTLNGQSFAVRSEKAFTLKKLAGIFARVTGATLNINWGERQYRPREVMTPWNKGKLIPGWKPGVSLEEGIGRTFNIK